MTIKYDAFLRRRVKDVPEYRWKVLAFLVKGGRPLSLASNYTRTRAHAEHRCLSRVPEESSRGATLYVVRMRRGGTLGMAKPCSACEQEIRERGVERVYYSNAKNDWSVLDI